MQTSYKLRNFIVFRGAAEGVAGALCLLSASAASAQPGAPAIVMSGDAPASMPLIAPAAAPPQQQNQLLVSANLKDALVSDALSMIADQGHVGIIIGPDIKESISMVLNDETPADAIRLVARAANLAWTRSGKTYIVARSLPDEFKSAIPAADQVQDSIASPGAVAVVPDLLPMLEARRDEERATLQTISIRNVSPRLMAWWINPSKQQEPVEMAGQAAIRDAASRPPQSVSRAFPPSAPPAPSFSPPVTAAGYGNFQPTPQTYTQASPQIGGRQGGGQGGRQGGGQGGGQGGQNGGGLEIFELPDGVDSLVAIDPLNVLLVRGTTAGVNELKTVIAFLDQPIPQVEIEAQFVTLRTRDRNAFGIDFSGTTSRGNALIDTSLFGATELTSSIRITRGQLTATLQSLVARDLAKVVNSPRITTLNNLTAQLSATSTLIIPTTDTIITPQANGGSLVVTNTILNRFFTGVVLTVTPTINRDGTITIAMQPYVSVPTPIAGLAFPQSDSQTINTISNVKDGDTLAIGGLRLKANSDFVRRIPLLSSIPLIGGLFRSKAKDNSESELIIFVTARIVRRTEEPVPGT